MGNTPFMKVSLVAISLAVMGCATEEVKLVGGKKKAMNQPTVDELVLIAPTTNTDSDKNVSASTVKKDKMPPAASPRARSVEIQNQRIRPSVQGKGVLPNVTTQTLVEDSFVSRSPLVASNWSTQKRPTTIKPFEMLEGESYKSTLTKWLNQMGYKNVRTVLTKADERIFSRSSNVTEVFVDTLPVAIQSLTEHAAKRSIGNKMENGVYLSFNGRSATVYSATPEILIHQRGEKPNQDKSEEFQLFKGETYEAAISRWIGESGYKNFGKLLDSSTHSVLSQKVKFSQTYNEPLEKSATLLLYTARKQAQDDERTERENFLSEKEKSELQHHLYLDAHKSEAILTSSNQPVVMFHVTRGSLKSNFLRLTKAFGWEADDSHYMAQDYVVSFGYPIVSEKGNIKSALSDLLTSYPKLRGGIVASTRQSFVLMEQ
ncbi:hypothetical protein [Enterovibrio norvegicus]|uniref:hypothetical protein n=1 Tax=Enterovibrio norvegicus TaxID=188144 RepID=UPI000C844654|nr:hypothetical protein [Enterovibrio norvegicus]PMH64446.1 hypothetical protein BCU62_15440 [Enterovibrio norvegicus]